MVKTSDGIMDTSPLGRMETLEDISAQKKGSIAAKKKELEELENKKKRSIEELEEKKKKELEELEGKKKELKDLEKQKEEEIALTQELIERSFQDLMRHKRMLIAEEDDSSKRKTKLLEDTAAEAQIAKPPIPQDMMQDFAQYSFTKLKEPKRVYQAANPSFYANLTELRERAARGEITPQEEEFVGRLRTQFENFNNRGQSYLQNNDHNNYVARSMMVINDIIDTRRDTPQYTSIPQQASGSQPFSPAQFSSPTVAPPSSRTLDSYRAPESSSPQSTYQPSPSPSESRSSTRKK